MRNDIIDFSYLKFFCIFTHCWKEISSIQIIWEFPNVNWVKVNTNGAARGCPSFSAYAGISWKQG